MTDAFKIPSVPIDELRTDDKLVLANEPDKQDTHAAVCQPELPPADFTSLTRHKNLQYDVPESSSIPSSEYTLEVLRNGSIIDYISLSHRAYTVFGRSPDSDVVLQHPTISRYHAIVQYKSDFEHGQSAGLYLYDCGSTHGTFINKKRLEAQVYVRIKIGYIIKFGQSTRLYVVQGDALAADEDANTHGTGDDVTHEQMKQFHAKRTKALTAVRAKRENLANETQQNTTEMDWGMGPDVDETTIGGVNGSAENVMAQLDLVREAEEETKKRVDAMDLKNRLEYQKARNDKAVLQEIMSRVSRNRM
jgi:pSer/pThr/pTyr-binding forkhead associated (FHA) protein